MIFETVSQIRNKEEFLEKILIYIRLVEVIAERETLLIPAIEQPSDAIVSELKDMGIVDSDKDLHLLKKIVGVNYSRFISAIGFYLSNRGLYGNLLDKLSNKKRKSLQEESLSSDKPKIVDFFAGAGGLSCGFTQAGYRVCFANDFEDVCVRTYRFNHPELPSNCVLKGDIRKIVSNIGDYVK
jgi:DNA (cytosine-5)-methyltransferase 1